MIEENVERYLKCNGCNAYLTNNRKTPRGNTEQTAIKFGGEEEDLKEIEQAAVSAYRWAVIKIADGRTRHYCPKCWVIEGEDIEFGVMVNTKNLTRDNE